MSGEQLHAEEGGPAVRGGASTSS